MNNRVREFRTKANLSQTELANQANTSQTQLQRVESGATSVRLDVAQAICRALGKPLEQVFPQDSKEEAANVVSLSAARHRSGGQGPIQIDDSPFLHRFAFWLKGGHTLELSLPQDAVEALEAELIVGSDPNKYLLIASQYHRIAINRRHITRAYMLWDEHSDTKALDDHMSSGGQTVNLTEISATVLMADEAEPVVVDVEPDEQPWNHPENPGLLSAVFYRLAAPYAETQFFSISDVDGETALFSFDDVSAIVVDERYIDGKFASCEDVDDADDV